MLAFDGVEARVLVTATGSSAPAQGGPDQAADPRQQPDAAESTAGGSDLTADQVYAVLVAEIAARRGAMDVAVTHYLEAAELTKDPRMAELAVRAALGGDDTAAIDAAVRRWLELDPASKGAHQVGAFARISASDQEGALIHLMRLIELSPDDPDAAFSQAAAIVARAPSPRARVALMRALADQYPDSAYAQQSLAMVAASASEFDTADAAARRAIELRPEWNTPRLFLVKLLLSGDQRGEARALLEGYLNESPDDQALRMLYGQFLVEEEEFSSARTVFERLLGNRPKEPDVLFAVGILSLQLDDMDGARVYFTRLYETGERQDDAAFYLGQAEERAENRDVALSWYEKVKGANAVDAQVRIALLRAQAGQIQPAREVLQRLRRQMPDNAVMLYMVESEILDSIGHEDDSLAVLDRALQAFPDNEALLYARAMAAVKQDRIELAEQDLRRIIATDPNHADALNALGYTLADRTDRYEEARVLIERAHALKPDEPAILDSMGWVQYRLGNLEQAHAYLRQALGVMSDGEIAAHLGEVLWAMGREAEAREVWNAALEAHPDHDYLKEVVGRYPSSHAGATPAESLQ
jgi:tetratricopeptide (TPR) repeat protein